MLVVRSDDDDYGNAGIYANIKRVQDEDMYGRLMDYARLPVATPPPVKVSEFKCIYASSKRSVPSEYWPSTDVFCKQCNLFS